MFGLIASLITGGMSLAKDWRKSKSEEILAKQKMKQTIAEGKVMIQAASAEAKAKAMVAQMNGDIAWDRTVAGDMSKTWKDEYLTIFATSPYWLAMAPAIVGVPMALWSGNPTDAFTAVNNSIDCIRKFPEALHYGAGLTYAAGYGIKKATDLITFKKGV